MADEQTFPRRFGKYKLLAELAQGGMGAVYLAAAGVHGMEKVCALKVVLPGLATPEYRARFMDEGKVMVRLTHGNLVQVFDVGEVGDEAYIAMEHVTGQDLRTIWNRCVEVKRAFPVDVAIHILKDACRGLAYAHTYEGLRLVHRDISPPNVMVTYAGETKVMDFGLAHSALKLEHTQPGLVFGKVPYMSPEQARGDPLDGRTDVYAVGVVLWELLTGRRLFPSDGNQAAEIAARARNPEPPSTREHTRRVPPGLDALVLRSLAPEPDDRFATAEEMSAALGRFLSTNWPGTDSHRVASFIQDLFGEVRVQERQRIEAQLQAAADLDAEIASGESFPNTSGKGPAASGAGSGDPGLVGGRYRLGRKLGEGGMGEVWEAEHADIGKRVAVKLLHRGYGKNADLVSRFKREARVASRIDHPGITDVTDFGVSADGRLYFVMELLEGRLLSDLLDGGGALPLPKALDIGLQLCSAMTAAHEAELVHRDLKPDNVMLVRRGDGDEHVKILDFGIAKELSQGGGDEHLTRPGTTLGTPEYMAPEQAAGQGADARSDVFAVGVILYEMLTGRPPHTGASAKEVLFKKLQEPIPPLDSLRADLPPDLSAVIMRCLAASPDARPRSMREVAVVLEAVKDAQAPGLDIPISAAFSMPSGGSRSLPGWRRRKDEATQVIEEPDKGRSRRPLLVGGLALGIVTVVGLGIAFWPFSTRANGSSGSSSNASSSSSSSKGDNTMGGRATGDNATGGNASRDNTAGGNASRDNAAGGNAAGGNAAGGNAAGGNAAGGNAAGGNAAGGNASRPGTLAFTGADRGADTGADRGADTGADRGAGVNTDGRAGQGSMGRARPGDHDGSRPATGPDLAAGPDPAEGRRRRARIAAADQRTRGRELSAQAHRHIAAGRHEAARRDLLELAAIPGQRGTALTGLARLAFERGQLAEAAQTARRAVAAGGGTTAQMYLANSLLKLGRYREAAAEYRRVLRSRPGHSEATRNLGLAESRLK